jgi:hypothetical protein
VTARNALVEGVTHLYRAKAYFEALVQAYGGYEASDATLADLVASPGWENTTAAEAKQIIDACIALDQAIGVAVTQVAAAGPAAAAARDLTNP